MVIGNECKCIFFNIFCFYPSPPAPPVVSTVVVLQKRTAAKIIFFHSLLRFAALYHQHLSAKA